VPIQEFTYSKAQLWVLVYHIQFLMLCNIQLQLYYCPIDCRHDFWHEQKQLFPQRAMMMNVWGMGYQELNFILPLVLCSRENIWQSRQKLWSTLT
jgi:hypothetical protein